MKINKRIMASISLLFPEGEQFFVRTIRRHEKELPVELQKKMQKFFGDEARHTRWHREFNNTLGIDIESVDKETLERLQSASFCNKDDIKTTMVLEQITYVLAHVLPIIKPVALHGLDNVVQSMWLKHAKEEREHVPDVAEVGHYLGVTNFELLKHYPTVLKLLGEQVVSNYKRL